MVEFFLAFFCAGALVARSLGSLKTRGRSPSWALLIVPAWIVGHALGALLGLKTGLQLGSMVTGLVMGYAFALSTYAAVIRMRPARGYKPANHETFGHYGTLN